MAVILGSSTVRDGWSSQEIHLEQTEEAKFIGYAHA
jgi:hypothetical protein